MVFVVDVAVDVHWKIENSLLFCWILSRFSGKAGSGLPADSTFRPGREPVKFLLRYLLPLAALFTALSCDYPGPILGIVLVISGFCCMIDS